MVTIFLCTVLDTNLNEFLKKKNDEGCSKGGKRHKKEEVPLTEIFFIKQS